MIDEHTFRELKTPCFVFDQAELDDNFQDFKRALHDNWSPSSNVAYSVKTNPFPYVLERALACGCMAEVVSDAEYDHALECGFAPQQIIFNGPIKGRPWFEYALSHGSLVNIDSQRELAWVKEIASNKPSSDSVKIGIRVNVDIERYCPGQTITGAEKGRFGFSFEDGSVDRVIEDLHSSGIEIKGLHMHITTKSRSNEVYAVLAQHAAKVIETHGLTERSLEYVDIGGGFYGGGDKNRGAYDSYAKTIAENLSSSCDPERTALYVEPGGAVVCTPGYYAGKVIDVKDVCGKRFVITELSRLNIDHEMKKTAYPLDMFTASTETCPSQCICGFTCMESDRLCTIENANELSCGDLLVIRYAGAYSMSFTPGFFIEYPPAVYAYDGSSFKLLREPFSKKPPQ